MKTERKIAEISQKFNRILADAKNGADNIDDFEKLISEVRMEYYSSNISSSMKETNSRNLLEKKLRSNMNDSSNDDPRLILPNEIKMNINSYNTMSQNAENKYSWQEWKSLNGLETFTMSSKGSDGNQLSASASYRSHGNPILEKTSDGMFVINEKSGKGHVFPNPIISLEQGITVEYLFESNYSSSSGRRKERVKKIISPAIARQLPNGSYILEKKGLIEVEAFNK